MLKKRFDAGADAGPPAVSRVVSPDGPQAARTKARAARDRDETTAIRLRGIEAV
jgi:hypothetical protein